MYMVKLISVLSSLKQASFVPNTQFSSAKVSNSSPRRLAVVKKDFQHDLQANSAFVNSVDNSDRN